MLRVCLVGNGRISRKHQAAMLDNSELFKLVAVCDIDAKRLVGLDCGVVTFNSVDEISEAFACGIDLFVICTPSGTHGEVLRSIMRLKKPCLVEKPFVLSAVDLEFFSKVAGEVDAPRIFLVKQNRYNNAVVQALSTIREGLLGKLLFISARVHWCRPSEYYLQDDWRGTYELDGGVVANQASHYLDLIEYFGGHVSSVAAIGGTLNSNIQTEDTCFAHGVCEGGSPFNFEATTAVRPKNLEGSLTLVLEHGVIRICGESANLFEVHTGEISPSGDDRVNSELPTDVYGFGHSRLYRDIHTKLTVGSGSRALVDLKGAIESTRSLHMFYRAMETGEPISRRELHVSQRLGVSQ